MVSNTLRFMDASLNEANMVNAITNGSYKGAQNQTFNLSELNATIESYKDARSIVSGMRFKPSSITVYQNVKLLTWKFKDLLQVKGIQNLIDVYTQFAHYLDSLYYDDESYIGNFDVENVLNEDGSAFITFEKGDFITDYFINSNDNDLIIKEVDEHYGLIHTKVISLFDINLLPLKLIRSDIDEPIIRNFAVEIDQSELTASKRISKGSRDNKEIELYGQKGIANMKFALPESIKNYNLNFIEKLADYYHEVSNSVLREPLKVKNCYFELELPRHFDFGYDTDIVDFQVMYNGANEYEMVNFMSRVAIRDHKIEPSKLVEQFEAAGLNVEELFRLDYGLLVKFFWSEGGLFVTLNDLATNLIRRERDIHLLLENIENSGIYLDITTTIV